MGIFTSLNIHTIHTRKLMHTR